MSGAGTYRLTKGGHSRRESAGFRRYARNDEIILTAAEAAQLRGRVQLISESVPVAESVVDPSVHVSEESPEKITPPATTRTRRARRS